jgi:release factor glutamine methyltransferase
LDISSAANLTTATTLEKNVPRQFNSVIQCDLLSGLRVDGIVDVLVFNPPYVPTEEDDDDWAGDIGYAWRGGGRGMLTTWRVLDLLPVRM